MSNIHACLVHEEPDCVADLVANLRRLDPASVVLLYDGSPDHSLLHSGALTAGEGVLVHPEPRPMIWGRLHGFAFDCLRFALETTDFSTVTMVDSDQLLVRPGYADALARHLRALRDDRGDVGCLVSHDGGTQPRDTRSPLARMAWREFDLWRPFLRRFAHGEQYWPTWTFWPGTVVTRAAAADLVELANDRQLEGLLHRTRLWATEELVLPTLVALRGHSVVPTPLRDDLVRFRVRWSAERVAAAAEEPELFWVHPVPRRLDDPVRGWVRSHVADRPAAPSDDPASMTTAHESAPESAQHAPLLEPTRLIRQMQDVDGWFSPAEGELLLGAALRALTTSAPPHAIVEVGSYCGRSTLVLGTVARAVDPSARVVAIDPHQGTVGSTDTQIHLGSPTWDTFLATIRGSGLEKVVQPVRACSFEVEWGRPISMILIDGLHDFASVAADYSHFESHLVVGAMVAFHDYTPGYPGVVRLVDHLASIGALEWVQRVGSLAVLRYVRPTGVTSLHPVLDEMSPVPGWLSPDEAAYLALLTAESVRRAPDAAVVEVGSYAGKATVVLARASSLDRNVLVHAVDTFDGVVGSAPHRLFDCEPTWEAFRGLVDRAGLVDRVVAHRARSWDVAWEQPISLLVVDGWHDYASVRSDVDRFAPHVVRGGTVAFHDHADYEPDVTRVLAELVDSGEWERCGQVGTLAAVRRTGRPAEVRRSTVVVERQVVSPAAEPRPVVSCLMPTRDRPELVRFALGTFAQQGLPERELIVVDDGREPVERLVAGDPRVVYLRPPRALSIGAKRNLAAEAASGSYLAHWDDDDWYAGSRLATQLAVLQASTHSVVGAGSLHYWEPATGRAWSYVASHAAPGRWAHDATLLLARSAWESHPYPDANHGLDVRWLAHLPPGSLLVEEAPWYVGLIHEGNTSRKHTEKSCWTEVPRAEVEAVVGDALPEWSAAVEQVLTRLG